jgi:hypothetical protein
MLPQGIHNRIPCTKLNQSDSVVSAVRCESKERPTFLFLHYPMLLLQQPPF